MLIRIQLDGDFRGHSGTLALQGSFSPERAIRLKEHLAPSKLTLYAADSLSSSEVDSAPDVNIRYRIVVTDKASPPPVLEAWFHPQSQDLARDTEEFLQFVQELLDEAKR